MKTPVETEYVEKLQARLAKVEAAHVALLRAPYMEWYPYAISLGCALHDHPSRWPEGKKPEFKPEGCVCGKRKDDE